METVITLWQPRWHTGRQQPLRLKEASWHRLFDLQTFVPQIELLQQLVSHFLCSLARLLSMSWEPLFPGIWRIVIITAQGDFLLYCHSIVCILRSVSWRLLPKH